MSLNKDEVNALNVLELRKLNFIPSHFSKLCIEHKVDIKLIELWIEYHLNSRYAIKTKHILDQNKKIIETTVIGIEDPKELTILSLGCQSLHKVKKEN